jgi:hypothetical protein
MPLIGVPLVGIALFTVAKISRIRITQGTYIKKIRPGYWLIPYRSPSARASVTSHLAILTGKPLLGRSSLEASAQSGIIERQWEL